MTFKDLHYGEVPLLLPNAWDVPSALALQACGFTADSTGFVSSRTRFVLALRRARSGLVTGMKW